MPERTSRLIKIYNKLKSSAQTIETLKLWAKSRDIDVSERQLYRDIQEIEKVFLSPDEQFIVKIGEKNRKIWKIEFDNSVKEKLTTDTLNTFYLLKNFAPLNIVASRAEDINRVEELFYKHNSKSKFELSVYVNQSQIKSSQFYEVGYTKDFHKILNNCIWAVQNQRELVIKKIRFDHTGLPASFKLPQLIRPLQILYHRGCIHLCGMLKNNKKVMVIAIEQIEHFELTNHMFDSSLIIRNFEDEMISRFGVTENVNSKIYNIKLEFSELTGSFISNHFWHDTQHFSVLKNGNYTMTLTCGINRELVGWIFQWMSNVKVIEPPELKELVKQKIDAMQNLYKCDEQVLSNNVFRPH